MQLSTSQKTNRKLKKVFLFGHFGEFNSGNDSTLEATLFNLRRFLPEVDITCICDCPEAVAAAHGIHAVPISITPVKPWNVSNPLIIWVRKIFIGLPSELYRWLRCFKILKGADMFIIPGTGLLTDVYGLRNWGPYSVFVWSLMAKLRRSRVLFVSVGAGPIYSRLGRWLVRSALTLADFRSYRDKPSRDYLIGIGMRAEKDRISPDLAFSLPEDAIREPAVQRGRRSVVGLGLMEYAGRYGSTTPNDAIYHAYLESLVILVKWLLDQGYDISLVIGDASDRHVTEEFKNLLRNRMGAYDEHRVADEAVVSVEGILSQLARTDIVIATRFHNILLSLLLNKPAMSISFHHKCTSLMEQMGLREYCQDITRIDGAGLIRQFENLRENAEKLKPLIREKVGQARKSLEEQYNVAFNSLAVE